MRRCQGTVKKHGGRSTVSGRERIGRSRRENVVGKSDSGKSVLG